MRGMVGVAVMLAAATAFAEPPPVPPNPLPPLVLPPAESVRDDKKPDFKSAERLMATGKLGAAWRLTARLDKYYPYEPSVQILACRLQRKRGNRLRALEHCEMALKVSSGPEELELLVELGRRDEAMRRLRAVTDGLGRSPADWRRVGEIARQLGAIQDLEKIADRSGSPPELREQADSERRRAGLPRGRVPYDAEPEVFALLSRSREAIGRGDLARASKTLASIESRFGEIAAVRVVRCELYLESKRLNDARSWCNLALALDAEAAWAHVLLARMDARERKPDDAIAHLEKAYALMPHAEDVRAELVRIYRKEGRDGRLEQLGEK